MSRDAGQQEIERELRRRAIGGAPMLEMLTWLKGDPEARIRDPVDRDGTIAFCMISTFTAVFDLGLTPGRFIASWDRLGGHLNAEELAARLGPLTLAPNEEPQPCGCGGYWV
ncbi:MULTISPECIES: hypothetical protein [unclassified Streptomyces]|uniref:hypothetical protein n=1 Tax=unclassified Streptomyces TaxID=2593676 RepID=UPI002E80AC60|nr:hypothetical protein [Streptomyces sp. NBC_00523]WUC98153.1 hypothetical protein OHS17_00005 [Streptomyces sp. NBC_00523]WUD04487.1 hypothetical protein OHS17_32690 [Streptomyces sp. NBC_00523]